jgi:Rps23 Pro-64 3,4-dihydroxylase Tpa1-like proline 4-hydroxylase
MKYIKQKSYEDYFLAAEKESGNYSNGHPFPHICIDDFFQESVLEEILAEFPNLEGKDLFHNNTNEKKFASKGEYRFGEKTKEFMYFLNSQPMLEYLSKLTGIENLIPDPYFWGGGLHQIKKGGFLKIHADFNVHPTMKLDRRLNLLIYLNKDWKEEFGGAFELWDENMKQCENKIFPLFNRLVVFTTTSTSYHGHPDPLKCPDENSRKSLALYYYTNGRPEEEKKPGLIEHTTLFRKRSELEDAEMDTKNVDLSIERSKKLINEVQKNKRRSIIKKILPPILLDIKNYLFYKK